MSLTWKEAVGTKFESIVTKNTFPGYMLSGDTLILFSLFDFTDYKVVKKIIRHVI